MVHVALLFPTGSDPRSPYLALPCLAAHLRRHGISVSMHDLDIGGIRALLDPEYLAVACQSLQIRNDLDLDDATTSRLLGRCEALPETASDALSVFRDPARFFEPPELSFATDTILDCLDIHSAALSDRLHYSINPVCYDIDGISCQSLGDLIDATKDDRYNLFARYWEESIFPKLAREDPLLTGITITNRQQIIPGLTLARRLRERGHFVVLGGALFTKFTAALSRLPEFFKVFADGIIVYEGETALVELVGALEGGARDFSQVPNLLYLNGSEVQMTTTHVENVASLPCPDFSGLPLTQYMTPIPVLPTYIGKGCYFNRCKFCDIPYINQIAQKPYRLRSPERVVADLETLNRRFDCRHFEFTDEALPPRTLEQLADLLLRAPEWELNFVGYARLEPAFTARLCQKLATAGIRKLFFGLESGAQETLDHMDKGIRLDEVPQILRNCADAGIHFHLFSIIGFPEETERLAQETFAFFQKHTDVIDSPGNSFDVHPFGLELRTPYAEHAEQFGIVIEPSMMQKDFVIGAGHSWINSKGMNHESVQRLVTQFNSELKKIYRRYHAGPNHLWPGFEEFSVLYADHYRNRPFPYRTCITENGVERFTLRWNPAVCVEHTDADTCFARSRYADAGMTTQSYALIDGALKLSLGELVDVLCGDNGLKNAAAIRVAIIDTLNHWISTGILQLIPESVPTTATFQ